MVSRGELFAECRELIAQRDDETAEFDTTCIFQDLLGDKFPMFAPKEPVPDDKAAEIRSLAKRRSEGYPLQYLLGQWEFWGCNFKVGEGVLIPRPDTETLVEQVLDICRREHLTAPKIADLCSGSGCIAVALKKELPQADVWAVELSDKALYYLRQNTVLNGCGDIHIISGDVLRQETARAVMGLDILVSNPPYLTSQDMSELMTEVRHEPASALFGGEDGLGFYRAITELWKTSVKDGGYIAYEYGMGQHDAVKAILESSGFTDVELRRDGGGIIRTAAAKNIIRSSFGS
ncbi:MAG: peptide chain release factor N(5)-glutamine methyltransferase [Ruminococcus sp.]|uniref:peptide chain release factor N(5)-glutamine methyltransferase n=1 Tax=Ruminococcus sp. TaxID=41978 RepID=UPI0025FFF29F|nr:peptide chain release factor N(5)-glutamine methyltransferase [Ruminococcus sp.]MCR5600468.1 peptide chain release factor N(5)-glutamine methyltransferase [Ruminococcus sp.]